MLAIITGPLRLLSKAILANDSTTQLALGFTLGMVIGMVPKANLIAVALGVLLCSVKVNRAMGLLAACAFSWIGTFADPFTHKLGLKVLQLESLQSTYAALFELPLGPWIGFHNSVVIGSLLLGLYVTYPVYWFSYVTCARMRPVVARHLRRFRVNQLATAVNVGSKWGTS